MSLAEELKRLGFRVLSDEEAQKEGTRVMFPAPKRPPGEEPADGERKE